MEAIAYGRIQYVFEWKSCISNLIFVFVLAFKNTTKTILSKEKVICISYNEANSEEIRKRNEAIKQTHLESTTSLHYNINQECIDLVFSYMSIRV